MFSSELINIIKQNDSNAKRQVFELYYGKLSNISLRYSKNQEQAEDVLHFAFTNCFNLLVNNIQKNTENLDLFFQKEFIYSCIRFIKNMRSDYFVSSTVYAINNNLEQNDLFQNTEKIDLNKVEVDILIGSLQQLVPSQRITFNLIIIDDFSISETANIIESSEESIKRNLENARYNLQKNIEKFLKGIQS